MPEPVACYLCGGSETTIFLETHDRLLDLPGSYRFVRCQACGLIYVNPRPTWAERAAHYAPAYRGYHRLATASSPLQRRSMGYGLHKRHRLIAAHISHGRLLDVGCAGGDFLGWMRQRPGWQVFGLERVPEIAQLARRQYGLPIVLGDQLHAGFAPGVFDLVTLWTVLEHLPDPAQGLLECARLLRPGGFLVLRTINVESWGARLFGPYWVGYDAPRILTVFSRCTLGQLLRKTGFEVIHLGSHFHDFYPYVWSWRNLCQARLRSPALRRLADRVSSSWPMRLLSAPFFTAQTLLGKNSFVTAIARKP